jgi:hypothetical protein
MTTVIVYQDGFVDRDDLDRAAKVIGGEVAFVPVLGNPHETIAFASDEDGLVLLEFETGPIGEL